MRVLMEKALLQYPQTCTLTNENRVLHCQFVSYIFPQTEFFSLLVPIPQGPDFLAPDELDWSETAPPGWEEKEEYDPLADAIECEDYLPPIEGAEQKPKTRKLSSYTLSKEASLREDGRLLNGEPFLGPGGLAELRGTLAQQGKRMPDTYDRRNPVLWGRRSEPSQGGAPRVATFATRNQKTGATKPKFAPYPREELPLYGRNPVFNPRFGMK